MTDELKNCPFCGAEARVVEYPRYGDLGEPSFSMFEAYCSSCGIRTGFDSRENCIKRWNKRVKMHGSRP